MTTQDEKRVARVCSNCQYRTGGECRCVPPQRVKDGMGHVWSEYPFVRVTTPACGMWTHDRRGNQPPEDRT